MISERTLRQWRRDALKVNDAEALTMYEGTANALAKAYIESKQRILRLTQELLDLHLMKKG